MLVGRRCLRCVLTVVTVLVLHVAVLLAVRLNLEVGSGTGPRRIRTLRRDTLPASGDSLPLVGLIHHALLLHAGWTPAAVSAATAPRARRCFLISTVHALAGAVFTTAASTSVIRVILVVHGRFLLVVGAVVPAGLAIGWG